MYSHHFVIDGNILAMSRSQNCFLGEILMCRLGRVAEVGGTQPKLVGQRVGA